MALLVVVAAELVVLLVVGVALAVAALLVGTAELAELATVLTGLAVDKATEFGLVAALVVIELMVGFAVTCGVVAATAGNVQRIAPKPTLLPNRISLVSQVRLNCCCWFCCVIRWICCNLVDCMS